MKKLQAIVFVCLLFCITAFGQTWIPYNATIGGYLTDLNFPTNDSGYVLSSNGQVRKTFDGALSWSSVASPSGFIYSVFFVSGKTGFIGTDSSLYRTTDAGTTWTEVTHDNSVIFLSIYFVDASDGYAAGFKYSGDSTQLYKTSNGGVTWVMVSVLPDHFGYEAFYFLNSTTGFWASDGIVYATSNGGISFNALIPPTDDFWNIYFPNTDRGYVVGINSEFLKSTDGGINWTSVTYPDYVPYDLYFYDGQQGFVCGGDGFSSGWVQETNNGGISWIYTYTSAETFFCIDFPSDTVGYFGGDHGTVLKFTGLPNGISENQTKNDLRIYPNPSNGSMTIQNIIPGSEITIRDLSGQIIKTIKAESEVMIMNLENVAVGIYFIEMKNEKINAVQKIVVN